MYWSETDRLLSTDVSGLTGGEMVAHLDAVERQMKHQMRTERELLEGSLELVTDRPELMAREPRTGEPADQARIVCRVCGRVHGAPCWRVRAKARAALRAE